MFNKQSKKIRRDIYADLFLFRLFRLLQSKTYFLLPSATSVALRYFRQFDDAKSIFEVEIPIAILLNKEREYQKIEVLREILENMRGVVADFIGNLGGINDFQEHYSRYIIWCDAIMKDESYHLTAARWYQGYHSVQKNSDGSRSGLVTSTSPSLSATAVFQNLHIPSSQLNIAFWQ